MLDGDLPSPTTTLAILLGASAWPQSPKLASGEAFLNSALRFRSYVVSVIGHGVPKENVLDLFDDGRAPSEIDENIAGFLRERTKLMMDSNRPPRDLIVYYVGHGGFIQDDYFLAVRATSEDREGTSGFRMSSLASTLRLNAASLRRYIILDCCFSAQAYKEFMSAPLEVATRKTVANFDEYPGRGTALLCSSGAREPSRVPAGATYTMFSGALLDVLENGQEDGPPALSLKEVGEAATQVIRNRYNDTMVRPEVQSPDMRKGDVARLPLFANAALRVSSEFGRRLLAIEKRLTEFEPHLKALGVREQAVSAVLPRIGAIEDRLAKIEASAVSSVAADEQPESDTTRTELRKQLGISTNDWARIPPRIRIGLQVWRRARSIGFRFMISSILICSISLILHFGRWMIVREVSVGFAAFVYLATLTFTSRYIAKLFSGVFGLNSAVAIDTAPSEGKVASPSGDAAPWEGLDIVMAWRASSFHRIIGALEVASPYYEIMLIVYVAVTIALLVTGGEREFAYVLFQQ